MKTYKVTWTETKSILVEARNGTEAQELAFDFFYDNAMLEEQDLVSVEEDGQPITGEQVYSMEEGQ